MEQENPDISICLDPSLSLQQQAQIKQRLKEKIKTQPSSYFLTLPSKKRVKIPYLSNSRGFFQHDPENPSTFRQLPPTFNLNISEDHIYNMIIFESYSCISMDHYETGTYFFLAKALGLESQKLVNHMTENEIPLRFPEKCYYQQQNNNVLNGSNEDEEVFQNDDIYKALIMLQDDLNFDENILKNLVQNNPNLIDNFKYHTHILEILEPDILKDLLKFQIDSYFQQNPDQSEIPKNYLAFIQFSLQKIHDKSPLIVENPLILSFQWITDLQNLKIKQIQEIVQEKDQIIIDLKYQIQNEKNKSEKYYSHMKALALKCMVDSDEWIPKDTENNSQTTLKNYNHYSSKPNNHKHINYLEKSQSKSQSQYHQQQAYQQKNFNPNPQEKQNHQYIQQQQYQSVYLSNNSNNISSQQNFQSLSQCNNDILRSQKKEQNNDQIYHYQEDCFQKMYSKTIVPYKFDSCGHRVCLDCGLVIFLQQRVSDEGMGESIINIKQRKIRCFVKDCDQFLTDKDGAMAVTELRKKLGLS